MIEDFPVATGQAVLLLILSAVWIKRSIYGPQKTFARLTCALLLLSLAAFGGAGDDRESLMFQLGGLSLLFGLAVGLIALIVEISHQQKPGPGSGA